MPSCARGRADNRVRGPRPRRVLHLHQMRRRHASGRDVRANIRCRDIHVLGWWSRRSPCPAFAKAAAGAVYHPEVRESFRATADEFVFVVDSRRERVDANEDRRDELFAAFAASGLPPVVLQLNKRDLPNALSRRELLQLVPGALTFESIATKSIGVREPFEAAALLAGRRRGVEHEVRALLAQRRASSGSAMPCCAGARAARHHEGVRRRRAVADVSLTVNAGEAVLLVGRNGAGKTTLLRIATGFLDADAARLPIDGIDLAIARARRQSSATCRSTRRRPPSSTVRAHLATRARLKGIAATAARRQGDGGRGDRPRGRATDRDALEGLSPACRASPMRCSAIRRCSCSTSRRAAWIRSRPRSCAII